MKILLINPPTENILSIGVDSEIMDMAGTFPPIGLLYIATVLKKHHYSPVIIDCPTEKISQKMLIDVIAGYNPDVVGITTFTTTMTDVLICAKNIKAINSSIITVLGGHHIYSYPELSLEYENIDFILQGECDFTFLQLIDSIKNNLPFELIAKIDGIGFKHGIHKILNKNIAHIKDLDVLPIPDRDLLPNVIYSSVFDTNCKEISVISSRGCPFNCSFCYSSEKKHRSRSAENIILEITELYEKGNNNFFFFDDLFSLSENKIIKVSEMILNKNLNISWSFRGRIGSLTERSIIIAKKAGLKRIQFGIESLDNNVLRMSGKNITYQDIITTIEMCKKHGIIVVGNFLIGLPGQTYDMAVKDIYMSRNIGLDFAEYNILLPLPNTRIYNDALKEGILPFDFWERFAQNPLIEKNDFKMYYYVKEISEIQQFELCNQAFKKFYFRIRFILKRIRNIRDIVTLKNNIIGAIKLLKIKKTSS